jgi:hypothetical protein
MKLSERILIIGAKLLAKLTGATLTIKRGKPND